MFHIRCADKSEFMLVYITKWFEPEETNGLVLSTFFRAGTSHYNQISQFNIKLIQISYLQTQININSVDKQSIPYKNGCIKKQLLHFLVSFSSIKRSSMQIFLLVDYSELFYPYFSPSTLFLLYHSVCTFEIK